tara:strand:- start:274 stop:720 length:447 start_codon:yes stop_codon:yes gene_type:complete
MELDQWQSFDKRKAKEEAKVRWIRRKNDWVKDTGIYSTDDLIADYVRKTNGHFFKPETMKFFNSRVSATLFPSPDEKVIYFLTSEQGPHQVQRMYTLRYYRPSDGEIGEPEGHSFQQYDTLQKAKQAAKNRAHSTIVIQGGMQYEECQ